MEFKCPKCEHDKFEEVMYNVVMTSVVLDYDEENFLDYGIPFIEDGIVDRYQCEKCGWVIRVETEEEMLQWIRNGCEDLDVIEEEE